MLTAPPVTPRAAHLDALDGLRAVAILLVVGTHVAAATGMGLQDSVFWRMIANGNVGVPIFFMLSGYLLYRPWARAALNGGQVPSARKYFKRRALRILPGYWLLLPVGLLVFNREHAGEFGTWFEFVTLTHTYDPDKWWQGAGPQALGPVWSLSVEATFYLILPVLARALHRFARGDTRRLLAAITAIGLFALAETFFVRYTENIDLIFYHEHLLMRSLVEFAFGMALAVLAERRNRLTEIVGSLPGVGWVIAACALALVATPLATPSSGPQSAPLYVMNVLLYIVIAGAIVAPAVLDPGQPLTAAVLANPVMSRLGLVSFGVFLWHSPIIEAWYALSGRDRFSGDFWTVMIMAMVLSAALASIHYVVVERPAQRLARR